MYASFVGKICCRIGVRPLQAVTGEPAGGFPFWMPNPTPILRRGPRPATMRTRSALLNARRRQLLLAAVLLPIVAAVACSSPTGTDAVLASLVEQQYRFACGAWAPGPPLVERALLDLRLWQIDTASAPTPALVAAIEAAGGRVVYRFHGPMVRAELNLAAVPRLTGPRGPLNSATTVVDPSVHDVRLIVMLEHDLAEADLQAVAALGGRVTHEYHAIEGYAVEIADARVPEVRVLPGVKFAGFNATFCLD